MSDLAVQLNQAFRALMRGERVRNFTPPESQDPVDPMLYRMYTSNEGRKFFDPAFKHILDHELVDTVGPDAMSRIKRMVQDVKDTGNTSGGTVLSTPNFALSLKVMRGKATLNKDALVTALRKRGIKQIDVEDILREASKVAEPSRTYSIIPL